MLRYPLSFAATGLAVPAAVIALEPAIGIRADTDAVYYSSWVLWPSLFPTYLWAPPEWVRDHLTWLRIISIGSNVLLYAMVGAWLQSARFRHPGLRFGVPVVAWASVAAAPWLWLLLPLY